MLWLGKKDTTQVIKIPHGAEVINQYFFITQERNCTRGDFQAPDFRAESEVFTAHAEATLSSHGDAKHQPKGHQKPALHQPKSSRPLF